MSELYKAIAGSPITYLSSDVSASQTTISIADDSALPDAPNICTIGYGENIETIRYGAKSNGVLQNVTRGIEGTPRAWPAGTEVARFFTAYDHNSILEGMVKKAGDTITGTLIFNNAIGIQGKDTNGDVFGLLSLNDSNEVSVGSKWKKAKILNNGFVSSDGTNEWNVWTDKNAPIQESFISPTLVNGWYNKTPEFRKIEYFKDKFGLVHISGGAIGGGASESIMFTLPVGYRPSAPIRIVTCNTGSTFGFIEIGSDGTVKHIAGEIYNVYIPPITFRAE